MGCSRALRALFARRRAAPLHVGLKASSSWMPNQRPDYNEQFNAYNICEERLNILIRQRTLRLYFRWTNQYTAYATWVIGGRRNDNFRMLETWRKFGSVRMMKI